jgi:hypothetical protein
VLEGVLGQLYLRLLVTGDSLDRGVVEEAVDLVLEGCRKAVTVRAGPKEGSKLGGE